MPVKKVKIVLSFSKLHSHCSVVAQSCNILISSLLHFLSHPLIATIWNGNFTANGGYIIVKETGDIICYHIYDKNRFENYLFNNIKLDTPSLSRHNCGKIYGNNGNHYIDLPLQLRFIR